VFHEGCTPEERRLIGDTTVGGGGWEDGRMVAWENGSMSFPQTKARRLSPSPLAAGRALAEVDDNRQQVGSGQ
jgi:hypothetical protein